MGDDYKRWLFDRAEKIEWQDYSGRVFLPHVNVAFASLRELVEFYEPNYEQMPGYVFACTEHRAKLRVSHILDCAIEDSEAPSDWTWKDVEGLSAFIEKWNAKQTDVFWLEDTSRVVVLDGLVEAYEDKTRKIDKARDVEREDVGEVLEKALQELEENQHG